VPPIRHRLGPLSLNSILHSHCLRVSAERARPPKRYSAGGKLAGPGRLLGTEERLATERQPVSAAAAYYATHLLAGRPIGFRQSMRSTRSARPPVLTHTHNTNWPPTRRRVRSGQQLVGELAAPTSSSDRACCVLKWLVGGQWTAHTRGCRRLKALPGAGTKQSASMMRVLFIVIANRPPPARWPFLSFQLRDRIAPSCCRLAACGVIMRAAAAAAEHICAHIGTEHERRPLKSRRLKLNYYVN
jgi:hypothetical protein